MLLASYKNSSSLGCAFPPVPRTNLLVLLILLLWAGLLEAADGGFEDTPYREFRTLDTNFVADSLDRINNLTRSHYGTSLRQSKAHDIALLQRLLDDELVRRDDLQLSQSAGVALGALLANELDLDWIRYEDELGVSRALRVRRSEQIFFPVTMISRRYKVGITPDVQLLYNSVAASVKQVRSLDAEYADY